MARRRSLSKKQTETIGKVILYILFFPFVLIYLICKFIKKLLRNHPQKSAIPSSSKSEQVTIQENSMGYSYDEPRMVTNEGMAQSTDIQFHFSQNQKKAGVFMSLFGKKERQEIEHLRSLIPDETLDLDAIQKELENARSELASIKENIASESTLLAEIKAEIIQTNEEVMYQSVGIYTPRYEFTKVDEYKVKLADIRQRQKDLVKSKKAVLGSSSWTVNGSEAKGRKMVADMQKLLLRAFNSECDDIIEHVKYNNIDSSEKRITSSRDAISRLGDMMSVSITREYYMLKIEELYLSYEYQRKKEEEKEALREARAQQREEAKAAKELEEARRKLEKEQLHYENALSKLNKQIAEASEDDKSALEQKRAELENQLASIDASMKDVDYRAANQRAGYVYIISNIGAFGENVYKIGMTRRLDPMDRVYELGDASVPFNFDVHAMIFTDDAPGLEAALHNAFADRKLNYINQRREFFNVTLDEIKEVVKKNYDKTVEFVDIAPAEQYRESLLMRGK